METVKSEASNLKMQGVDIIIVLSHCGLNVDYNIARFAGSDIDVIVGGHSHTFMFTGDNPPGPDRPIDEYPAVVEQESGHKVKRVVDIDLKVTFTKNLRYNISIFLFDNDHCRKVCVVP